MSNPESQPKKNLQSPISLCQTIEGLIEDLGGLGSPFSADDQRLELVRRAIAALHRLRRFVVGEEDERILEFGIENLVYVPTLRDEPIAVARASVFIEPGVLALTTPQINDRLRLTLINQVQLLGQATGECLVGDVITKRQS